jgi:flagellar hook-length control protein FliK
LPAALVQAQAASQDSATPQPAGKPKTNSTGSANDNNVATAGQVPAQQPDASAMAQAQSQLTAQSLPQTQNPAVAANDDTDDTSTTGVGAAGTAGSGKTSRGAAATAQSSPSNISDTTASDPAAKNSATGAVAAAQAAIKGVTDQASGNPGQGTDKSSGNSDTASSDKNAVQAANANSTSPLQPNQPAPIQPPAQTSMMAPGIAAASGASPGLATHTAAAGLSTSVQINAPAAGAVPDLASLAVAVAARSQSGAKQFDIRLDPPELGRVDVRLSIDANGKTQAHMTADQPETLNLLQKDSGTLTQALRDAGLDVSQNGLNFSLRGQTGQDSGGQSRGAPRQTLSASQVIDAVQTATSISQTSPAGDGRLDIHV